MASRATQAGFTLIEIMLVVLLIGITITFVNLNLDPDPGQIVRREADRMAVLLRQLGDESILRGRAMAMHVDTASGRYRFEVLEGGEWKAVNNDDLFHSRRIRQPVRAELSVEPGASEAPLEDEDRDNEDDVADGRSRVVVDPLGEITPFTLALAADGHRVIVGLDDYANVVARPVENAR